MSKVNRPMVKWEATVDRMTTAEKMAEGDRSATIAERHARWNAYISRRLSGGKHYDAVKAQNRAARKVRQALGYTYADDAITF